MMVLVEDKQNDIKQQFFYDSVPVGGKIRVFGSVTKFDENPQKSPKERKAEATAFLSTLDPEQLVPRKADNYHRWFRDWLGLRGKRRRNRQPANGPKPQKRALKKFRWITAIAWATS